MNTSKKIKAFTLIELLVVIAIIGILSGTVIVALSGTQESARDARIKSGMNQLRTVMEIYKASNNGDYSGIDSDPDASLLIADIIDQGGDIDLSININPVEDAYCAISQLSSSTSTWCIDSSGFSGIGGCSSYQCDSSIGGGTPPPWACGDSFTDSRDGNVYTTVEIGTQCWMKKNLAYLPAVHSNAEFANQTTSARYGVYDYDGSVVADAKAPHTNYSAYGVLYNHPATVDACPTGWKMPTDADFQMLERYLGMEEEEIETIGWRGTDEGSKLSTRALNGNNSSEFTALMSGYRYTDGSFRGVGSYARFWSSSEGAPGAWGRRLDISSSTVYRGTYSEAYGFSVRCLKN